MLSALPVLSQRDLVMAAQALGEHLQLFGRAGDAPG
jgi:hypothetical protein